jgi:hypothetical protein
MVRIEQSAETDVLSQRGDTRELFQKESGEEK